MRKIIYGVDDEIPTTRENRLERYVGDSCIVWVQTACISSLSLFREQHAEANDKTTPAENYFVCAKTLKSFVSDWVGLEEVSWDVRDTGIP